ncbi:MAG TPA: hypothetical protein PLW81_12750 [Thiobacillaceae bacterium]|nr:hypothetical protein [Thiobacillaceae bacterium]
MDVDSTKSIWGDLIFAYTRKDAIEDGVLIDVTETARTCGFVIPVAITSQAYAECVQWSEADNDIQTYQDESGRLKDVLMMCFFWIKKHGRNRTDDIIFPFLYVPRDGVSETPVETVLKVNIGPGDRGEPVLTIMEVDED